MLGKFMGHTYAKVRVYNLDLSNFKELELIVNTCSTYTWISKKALEELGIGREAVRRFRTIEGRTVERAIGMGIIECLGLRAPTVFVFAEEGDLEVLGVYALEGLGLEIDPIAKELRKVEAILAV